MNVVNQDQLEQYREDNTREVNLPDGSKQQVRMTPLLWDNVEFLRLVEGITDTEIAGYALEEVELQGITFDNAFRCVVVHLANRWQ